MSHYAELDRLIMDRLKREPASFTQLQANYDLSNEVDALAEAMGREAYRVLDGRLQALRKRGKIVFFGSQKAWHLAGAKP